LRFPTGARTAATITASRTPISSCRAPQAARCQVFPGLATSRHAGLTPRPAHGCITQLMNHLTGRVQVPTLHEGTPLFVQIAEQLAAVSSSPSSTSTRC
jgi:hypothetical protein